jgi:hypothetical protein
MYGPRPTVRAAANEDSHGSNLSKGLAAAEASSRWPSEPAADASIVPAATLQV